MHSISEHVLAAADQMDQQNLTPIQRIVFHELQEQLRSALDKITDLNIIVVCKDEQIKSLTSVNQKPT